MEERDDDDNESAVRALNTAMQTQANTLERFFDEDLPVTRRPAYSQSLFGLASTTAPSAEASPSGGSMPVDANTMVLARRNPSLPGDALAGYDIEDADDDIKCELEQLRLSEILLTQELARATSHEPTTLDLLTSRVMDATEGVCTTLDPPNELELRSDMARETLRLKRTPDQELVHAADQIINEGEIEVVDTVMEKVMDAVVEGCQGYYEIRQPKKPKETSKQKRQTQQKQSPKQANQKTRKSRPPPVHAKRGADAPMDATLPMDPPSKTSNLKSPMDMSQASPRQSAGKLHESITSASSQGKKKSRQVAITANEAEPEAQDPLKHSHNVGVDDQPEKPDHNTEGRGQSTFQQGVESIDGILRSSWHVLSTKMPVAASDSPEQVDSKKKKRSTLREDHPQAVTERGGGAVLIQLPSLLERVKSLSTKLMPTSESEAVHEEKNRARAGGNAIAGTMSMDTSSLAGDGKGIQHQVSAYAGDEEDPNGEEGHEVEAFYQQTQRLPLWERICSHEQHREWKNNLFQKEWVGVKRVYWVLLVLFILTTLLFGVVMLITEESSTGGSQNPGSNAYVGMFPTHTQASFQDPESPQSKAYNWLLNDPSFAQFSDERKVQRFALATLYFSTNGPSWIFANRVLDYNTDECQWFYSRSDRATPPACAVAGGIIEALILEGNNLQGTIPPELFLLTNLRQLSLAKNKLTSTIPTLGLDQMTRLRTLNLEASGLLGTIPETIGHLESLEKLNLAWNQLTGQIPLEVMFLSNLEELRLQRNGLNGTIPGTVLAGVKNLKQLYLFENSFSGPLSTEVGELQVLEDLFLYGNHLSSTVPTELGLLNRLQRLWLDRNQFTGNIPKQLGHLQNLLQLNLFSNKLSGTIPASLGTAMSLEQVQLNDNILTGFVPDRLCALLPLGGDNDIVRLLSVDCGEVTCDCDCTCPRPGSSTSLIEGGP